VCGVYEETILIIRDRLTWVGKDETTDADILYIANVIIGKLSTEPLLLCCKELEKCNYKTICQLINNAMDVLWYIGIIHNNVILLLKDVAPYMCKAGNVLNIFYPR